MCYKHPDIKGSSKLEFIDDKVIEQAAQYAPPRYKRATVKVALVLILKEDLKSAKRFQLFDYSAYLPNKSYCSHILMRRQELRSPTKNNCISL